MAQGTSFMSYEASVCEESCYGWSRHIEAKRDTPQINGSSSGVAFDAEQAHLPKRNHGPRIRLNSTDSGARPTWRSRLRNLFGRGEEIDTKENSQAQMRGGMDGWMQAGTSDDWTSEADLGASGPSNVREVTSTTPPSPRGTRFATPPSVISRSTSDSASSVRFDTHGIRGLVYPETRSSQLPNIHSQLSSPSTSPQSSHLHLRPLSPEPLPNGLRFDNDSREYVGSSGVVMRTLTGGTKFVEGL
ncbi:hypothetical protein DXG01_016627 [Tephrocybe rancida]|nr:hypothetical protein DXG01_016627 [Tephrocybe rancida]